MLGMFRQAIGHVSETELRNICARVGFGFLAIYAGANVEDALGAAALNEDDDIENLIDTLQLMTEQHNAREDGDDEIVMDDEDDEATNDEGNPFTIDLTTG